MALGTLRIHALAIKALTIATLAMTGLPAPSHAADALRACSDWAFLQVPGSDTCLRIGGTVRGDLRIAEDDRIHRWSDGRLATKVGFFGWQPRFEPVAASRGSARLLVESRTASEIGAVRTVFEATWQVDGGSADPRLFVDAAFVQAAGLTAGRAQSRFDHIGSGEAVYAMNVAFGRAWADAKVNLVAWRFTLSDGLSLDVSAEDPRSGWRDRPGVPAAEEASRVDRPPGRPMGREGLVPGGLGAPDLVGVATVAQGWGVVRAMAALHENRPARSGAGGATWGHAVGAAATVRLPFLAEGDRASLQAVWSRGAVSFASADAFRLFNIGADAVARRPGGRLIGTEAVSVAGGLLHRLTPEVEGRVNGGLVRVDGSGARDYRQTDAAAEIAWTLPAGLRLALGAEYRALAFTPATRALYSGRPGGGEANPARRRLRDADAWATVFRAERNF